jgi:ribonuclease-3
LITPAAARRCDTLIDQRSDRIELPTGYWMDVQALQNALGHDFLSKDLLQQALTHRSHSVAHNERLEFLGDSVLNCVVASLLFDKFSRIDEGDLSRLRANLVKQQSLYEIAQRLELSPYLRLGEGELKSGGFRRPSILADTVEALFGAIFLDAGFDIARKVIKKLYQPVLETVDPKTLGKDAKTLLQEYLQGRKIALPIYTVVATHGAAHSQEFEVECAVPKLAIQVLGGGGSRRAAEQAAAKKALEAAQSLAVAATKRTRRAKPAQLTLAVAVEQSAEPVAAARKSSEAKPRDVEIAQKAISKPALAAEPARIVAAVAAPVARAAQPDATSVASKNDAKAESKATEKRESKADARAEVKSEAKADGKDAPAAKSAERQNQAEETQNGASGDASVDVQSTSNVRVA